MVRPGINLVVLEKSFWTLKSPMFLRMGQGWTRTAGRFISFESDESGLKIQADLLPEGQKRTALNSQKADQGGGQTKANQLLPTMSD